MAHLLHSLIHPDLLEFFKCLEPEGCRVEVKLTADQHSLFLQLSLGFILEN
jgi:hypothetical protein